MTLIFSPLVSPGSGSHCSKSFILLEYLISWPLIFCAKSNANSFWTYLSPSIEVYSKNTSSPTANEPPTKPSLPISFPIASLTSLVLYVTSIGTIFIS